MRAGQVLRKVFPDLMAVCGEMAVALELKRPVPREQFQQWEAVLARSLEVIKSAS